MNINTPLCTGFKRKGLCQQSQQVSKLKKQKILGNQSLFCIYYKIKEKMKNMYKESNNKKAVIIEAASKVFIEKGYVTVTMKEISEASQIGRNSLYHYFSSVEEVYKELIDKSRFNNNDNENNISEFLETLKNELIIVDKRFYRAVVEQFMANRVNNCFYSIYIV